MRSGLVVVLCFIVLMMSGCGGSDGVETATVSGTVTLDGNPIEGVEVFFNTDKFEGYGKTDSDGKYRLINGAAVGNNKVFMKMTLALDASDTGGLDMSIPGMDERQLEAMNAARARSNKSKKSKPVIPPEYGDPSQTKLTFPVPSGGTTTADFNL